MSLFSDVYLKIPPFQTQIASSDHLPVRLVSKSWKQIFDTGLCFLWKQLKSEIPKTDKAADYSILNKLIQKIEIEEGGEPSVANSLLFFQKLKQKIREIGNGCVAIKASYDLPLKVDCIDFLELSPVYQKDNIPPEIASRAEEISKLKIEFEAKEISDTVPQFFLDPFTLEMMAMPVFDVSHLQVIKPLEYPSIPDDRLHSIDQESLKTYLSYDRPWAPSRCPICRHPTNDRIQLKNLRFNTTLQNRILAFLKQAVERKKN